MEPQQNQGMVKGPVIVWQFHYCLLWCSMNCWLGSVFAFHFLGTGNCKAIPLVLIPLALGIFLQFLLYECNMRRLWTCSAIVLQFLFPMPINEWAVQFIYLLGIYCHMQYPSIYISYICILCFGYELPCDLSISEHLMAFLFICLPVSASC